MLTERLSPQTRRYLGALVESRATILGLVIAVAIVAAIVSLFLPQWFEAEATLLPPNEETQSVGMLAGMIQSSALSKVGLLSTQTPSDVFAEILRSRTLHEELIRAFDLQKRYAAKNLDVTLKRLSKHISVDVNKAQLIVVRVEDRNPGQAADMANFLVDKLDEFNRETFSTHGKRVRMFLQDRLAEVFEHMTQADSALTAYEQKNKVLATGEVSAIQGVANVMAQRMSLQVQRSYVSTYTRGDNPMLKELDEEVAAYERELARMPALKQQAARLALEAELQRKLFSLLTAQYEDARLQEARDTPTVTVLDRARPPILRARPKRALIVVISTALAAVLALGWIALTLPEPTTPRGPVAG